MKVQLLCLPAFCLLGLSWGSPVQPRDLQTTIKFDDVSNAAPVPSGYNNLIWTNWDVRSPDRGQPSYVKYASPFQYGRVPYQTTGKISRDSNVSSFVISKLRYGCSAAIPEGGFSPGVPKPCTVSITANCANGHPQHATAKFNPTQPIANLGTLNLEKTISCTSVKSYTFTASGHSGNHVDLLVDNIVVSEKTTSA